MADDVERRRILLGDDGEFRVVFDDERRVDQLVVHAAGERGLRKSRANARGDFARRSPGCSNFFWLPSGSVIAGIGISESDQAVGRRSILPARPGRINSDRRAGGSLISGAGAARFYCRVDENDVRKSARPVRFAVVGLGHIAQAAVLPAFKHARPHAELTALVSDTPAKLRQLGQPLRRETPLFVRRRAATSSRAATSTPSTSRCRTRCMRRGRSAPPSAGLHVLCEKPLAASVQDCERMIEACERNGVHLMTAYRLHFERCNLEVADLVRKKTHRRRALLRFAVLDAGEGRQHPPGSRARRRARMGHRHLLPERRALRVRGRADAGVGHGHEQRRPALRGSTGNRARDHEIPAASASRTSSAASAPRIGRATRSWAPKAAWSCDPAFEYAEASELRTHDRRKEEAQEVRQERSVRARARAFRANACAPTGRPEPSGVEGLIDVAIIEAIHRSISTGGWALVEAPEKRRRPTLRQEMRRPAVPREPKLVQVESGHG